MCTYVCSGSVDGNNQLIIKGKFQQKQIETVLRRYISKSSPSYSPFSPRDCVACLQRNMSHVTPADHPTPSCRKRLVFSSSSARHVVQDVLSKASSQDSKPLLLIAHNYDQSNSDTVIHTHRVINFCGMANSITVLARASLKKLDF